MEKLEKVPKTALDVFRLLPEGTLCDVIENVLYISPVRKISHQRLLLNLALKISRHIENPLQAKFLFLLLMSILMNYCRLYNRT